MTDRIIFLDVDGPLIPSYMYINGDGTPNPFASKHRHFSTACCGLINHLCDKTNAKIVFNSSHNFDVSPGRDLKNDAINRGGIKAEHFHPVFRTNYYPGKIELSKKDAVQEWLSKNGTKDTKWVYLDDEKIMSGKNFILVDFDSGVTFSTLSKIYKVFGVSSTLIL